MLNKKDQRIIRQMIRHIRTFPYQILKLSNLNGILPEWLLKLKNVEKILKMFWT